MGLPGACFGVVQAGDLPHGERGPLVVEGYLDHRVGGLPGVGQAGLIGERHLDERVRGNVGGGLLAPRQRIKP